MQDYSQLKVPDLKKHLQERGLATSGNKADLVSRLQEHDKKAGGAGATAGDDEIDWDEDDKATTQPVAAAVAAGRKGQAKYPVDVPKPKLDTDPVKNTDLKVAKGDEEPDTSELSVPAAIELPKEIAKQDFSIGIQQTDAEKEAAKRAERAKRFGVTVDDEVQKKADRAKKFGADAALKESVAKSLDSALPERRAKRGREAKEGKDGGRSAKRQTPDRRTEPAPKGALGKKTTGRVVDDPVEKAKAEARAKRFQTAS